MMRKTNILVVSLIAMMSVGVARSESTTKEYVDSRDNTLAARIKLQNENMGMVRDWVNPKDANGNRTTLQTDAKTAFGAINELKAGIDNINVPTKTSDLTNDSEFLTATDAATAYQPKGNYLTEHQSLAGLATTEQLAAKADAADLADYLTETDAAATYQPKGNYLTEHQSLSAYETAEQAGAKYQPIGSYATTDQLATKANASDLSNYLTSADAATAYQPKGNYLTSADAATAYQPKGNYLTEHQSLSAYETAEQAGAKYQPIGSYATTDQLATKADASDLSNYLTSADAATAYQPKGNYLTEHQSLSAYETAEQAGAKYQPIGSYATTDQLATKADASDLSNYLTSADAATAYQPKGNYLTEHQSLSAYETAEQAGAKYQPIGSYATTGQLATKADASDLTSLENLVATTGQTIPSTIGETDNITTVVGAINALNTKTNSMPTDAGFTELTTRMTGAENDIDTLEATVGNTTLATTAQTVTGAVNELNTAVATKANSASLATVATSGSYNDLGDKPTIPTVDVELDGESGNAIANAAVVTALAGKANIAQVPAAQVQSDWTQTDTDAVDYIKHKPALATVATTGVYSDLTGTPTVDDALNASSTNAIQNRAVAAKVGTTNIPTPGQYVLGYVDGVPTYIAIVDADGNFGENGNYGD